MKHKYLTFSLIITCLVFVTSLSAVEQKANIITEKQSDNLPLNPWPLLIIGSGLLLCVGMKPQ